MAQASAVPMEGIGFGGGAAGAAAGGGGGRMADPQLLVPGTQVLMRISKRQQVQCSVELHRFGTSPDHLPFLRLRAGLGRAAALSDAAVDAVGDL